MIDDNEWYKISFTTAMEFARETIKGCILINGGAGAGLVAFLPNAKEAGFELSSIADAVMSFGVGLFLLSLLSV